MQPQKKQTIAPWRRLLQSLDWGCLAIIIIFGITVAGIDKSLPIVQRPVFASDATIAYKFVGDKELHFATALVVPALVLLATAAAMEFLVLRQQGWQKAAANFINIIFSVLATIAVVGFLTELFKRMCGRLRPDFLDRCQPVLAAGTNEPIPFGTFPNVECLDTDGSIIKDGHMSFPSGHSSCSMAFSLFSALYLLWCIHWRENGALHNALLCPASSVVGRIGKDLLNFAVLLLVLFDLTWPWGVAVSRFRDNRHNISDVLGGLFLASCFVPVFILRLISNLSYWSSYYEKQHLEQRTLPECQLAGLNGPGLDVAAGVPDIV